LKGQIRQYLNLCEGTVQHCVMKTTPHYFWQWLLISSIYLNFC
jgi:hypothetical protein